MASTILFVVMIIIAGILLFVASLTASMGAVDAYDSSFYNSESRVRSAHQYLTIAAALGWSALIVLITILIIGAIAGGFNTMEISDILLNKNTPTKEDLIQAYKGEKEISAGYTTEIIVLVVLIIIAIVTLIVGILAAIAATELAGLNKLDGKVSAAYIEAIIAAVSGIGGIGIMFIAIIAYIGIRYAREDKLREIQNFEKRTEKQLGISS